MYKYIFIQMYMCVLFGYILTNHEGKYELISSPFLCFSLHQVSSDMLTQCHFNYMEESVPVALEELGSELKQDWRGYLYACTTALLKEAREKYVHLKFVFPFVVILFMINIMMDLF